MLIQSEELRDKNYKIKQNLLEEAAFVDVDADRIVQVLDNILNNAVNYSPEGGTITCSMEIKNNYVVLSVKDEGIGIPEEDLKHIFYPFLSGGSCSLKSDGRYRLRF